MSLPIIVNPEAETDLAEAIAWYERHMAGLGNKFLQSVEETIEGLRPNPCLYAKVYEEARLVLVRRFPYAVIYRVDECQITILAIYHTSRDPRQWQARS